MHRLLRTFFTLLLIAFSAQVSAQDTPRSIDEIHVVGVYEGRSKTGDLIHGPLAHIVVDRPGKSVALVLGSYEPLRWKVTVTEGTVLTRIDMTGRSAGVSEVYIDGEPTGYESHPDLPYAYKSKGKKFVALVPALADFFETEGISSFHGRYEAGEDPFIIGEIQTDPLIVSPDPLATLVRPEIVPAELVAYVVPGTGFTGFATFRSDGFRLHADDGVTTFYPVSLDVPRISHAREPAGYDAKNHRIFGVSLGGEGFLYQYDIATDKWSVVSSMNGVDASGLTYDEMGERIIIAVQHFGRDKPEFAILGPDGASRSLALIDHQLLGYTDLFDPGNSRGPGLVPVRVFGDKMIAHAIQSRHRISGGHAAKWRSYLVDLRTGITTLVAYSNEG